MIARTSLLRRSVIAGAVALAIGVPAVCAGSAALADAPVSGSMKMYSAGTWYASGEFVVTNSSSQAQDWSLSFRVPAGEFQNNASWNTVATIDGDIVTLTPKAKLEAGKTANVGFGIQGQGTDELEVVGCDLDGHGVEGCSVGGGEHGDTQPPSFTEDLRAEATGPNTVDLAWAAADDNVGVTEYRIYDGTSQKPIATVDGSTHRKTIDGLKADTRYAFQVYAYDKAGNHSGSTVTEVITPATPGEEIDSEAPSYVERIDAEAVSPTEVRLDWSEASDNVKVHEYRIYDGRRFVTTVVGAITSVTLDRLTPDTGYAFQIYAYDRAGNHGGSTVAYVATPTARDTIAPTVPTNLTVDTVDSDSVHVMWAHSADNVKVAGYKIFQDGRQVEDLANGMRMTDIDGLDADTEYAFQVLAYDEAGNESEKSAIVRGTTAEEAITDSERPSNISCVEATATSATTVDVDWTAATDNVGVTKYVVHVGKDAVATVDGSVTTATLTGLKPGTVHVVSVHAYDAAGNHGVSVMTPVKTPDEAPGTGTPAPEDFAAKASSYNDGGRTMHRIEMTWTPDEATKRYEISLDGKHVQTLLVGADRTAAQKRFVLLGEHPDSRHTVQIRAQLADGSWTERTPAKTVEFTK
ncbi:fibronectin type III domain-containing protein [Frondihabitans sp. VKM Ac-2883]|uniref:fibronectin type III domain-containing protein n=1 Tax=Frondihabitans sp. VKM Ac-2883 TaxID=2783823 RepID=UPI001889E4C8|nr:fibronectin type III domain-containing protein [Frondihabitans sp. VKM Ac-2883]